MADFDCGLKADPHANGTIWAAALWDLRTELSRSNVDGGTRCDLLVLKSLLLIGQLTPAGGPQEIRRAPADYSTALGLLLQADEILYSSRHRELILKSFSLRNIVPKPQTPSIPSRGLPSATNHALK
ncbi:MAG: hypothetical protein M3O09_16280 [Acidobacteriota bacterium]|nr:hypothetical protein [Acidobacteriota bacterium]